jgi:hypothetical protein
MDSDNREFLSLSGCWGSGACQAIAMHLRDRAPKHEHQAEAKKDSADDFHFHVIHFPFLVLAFRDLSLLRTRFWPFN